MEKKISLSHDMSENRDTGYKHNIVQCSVCGLKDHVEIMVILKGKYVCQDCMDIYYTISNLINNDRNGDK